MSNQLNNSNINDFQQALKEWKNKMSIDIAIVDFDQNEFKVSLLNNKQTYYLNKHLSQQIQTGNYTQSITAAENTIGKTGAGSLPVMVYQLGYVINDDKTRFTFTNSTQNTPSDDKSKTVVYNAIPSNYDTAYQAKTYKNTVGDKQYELSNHLGNVLSVVTDKKLINVQRGISVLDERFNDDQTQVFLPTQQLEALRIDAGWLLAVNKAGIPDQGVYTQVLLQPNRQYILSFDTKLELKGKLEVIIKKSNDTYVKELIEEKGHYNFEFETGNQAGQTQLSFTTYLDAKGSFRLDNVQIIDVTDIDLEQILQNTDNMAIFVPDIMSYNDYYPYGMLMPNRHANSDRYRYGYQGSEKDDEVKGEGNSYTTLFRQLDVRLGKWLSIDPKGTAFESHYASMGNNPIWHNDILGDTIKISHRRGFLGLGKKETLIYRDGQLYNSNGKDKYTGKVKGFLKRTVSDLNTLRNKSFGKELVDDISDSKYNLTIRKTSDVNRQVGISVYFNSNDTRSGFDVNGDTTTKSFVILGHEMAHFYDKYLDNNNSIINPLGTWFQLGDKKIYNSEKFAVNVENLIRQEHSLPLRTHYAIDAVNNNRGVGKFNIQKIQKIRDNYINSMLNNIFLEEYMEIKPETKQILKILDNPDLYNNQ